MANVEHIFICLVHRFPMKELEEAEAIENMGLRGCVHGRRGSNRQVSIMDCETLAKLGLRPGMVKENIATRGIDFQMLAPGDQFRMGESLLEITAPCHPCSRMDEIRMGLREELRSRRGWLCRVVKGGTIHRGDSIEVLRVAEQSVTQGEQRWPSLKTQS